jgi:MFS transporter, ACS family, tartrate transporter
MGAIPLSSVLGSPFAGWILGHRWLAVAGWRWLFILEGLPAILLGVVAYFFLTDRPREASWLQPEQRNWIERKLREEAPAGAPSATSWQVLGSRTVLLLAGLTFLNYFASYSFLFWFPTMLKRLSGFSDARVGLLGALPYAATFVAMQVNGWHSDRTRDRRWHSAIPLLVSAAGLLALMIQPRSLPVLLAFFTFACLCSAYLPVFWAVPAELLGQTAAARAVGMINGVGSAAGFVGPYLFGYLNAQTGSFSIGLFLMALSAAAGGLMILYAVPAAPAARSAADS